MFREMYNIQPLLIHVVIVRLGYYMISPVFDPYSVVKCPYPYTGFEDPKMVLEVDHIGNYSQRYLVSNSSNTD